MDLCPIQQDSQPGEGLAHTLKRNKMVEDFSCGLRRKLLNFAFKRAFQSFNVQDAACSLPAAETREEALLVRLSALTSMGVSNTPFKKQI